MRSVYGRLVVGDTRTGADRAVLRTASRPVHASFEGESFPAPDAADPRRPWNSGTYVTDQCVWRSLARDDAYLALYACALAVDGRGVLLAGPSGCGKTTLALALARAGARLYGDEMALIHRTERTVTALRRRLMVREDGGGVRYLDTDLFGRAEAPDAVPLRALFIIEKTHAPEPSVAPLSRSAAALRLAGCLGDGRRSFDNVAEFAAGLGDAAAFALHAGAPDATARTVLATLAR